MKKTFPVNINGNIFYIDEDAYKLLLDYLSQLRATFTGEEGAEIVDDIESRISEHFDERIRLGANVIVLEDVNRVIETMGRPEELSDETDSTATNSADTATESAFDTSVPPYHGTATPPPPPIHKKLYRDVRHSVFGGVIAGLAQYFGWDVTVMRILAVVLTVCTYFWPCVILYLIAWMVIPVARTPREILEMQGQPVTLDNIGQTVINNSVPPTAPIPGDNPSSFSNFINTFFSIAAKFILGFLAIVFGLGCISLVGVIIAAIVGILLFTFADIPTVLDGLNINDTASPIVEGWGYVCTFFAILIPLLLVVRYSCIPLLRAKAPSTATLITAAIFEVLFIIGAITLLAIAENSGDAVYNYTSVYSTSFSSTLTAINTSFTTLAGSFSSLRAALPIATIVTPALTA
ncbi:MAG: PspC domain-containing protein [Duncaniella sp.]|nr:PspC domain-containing protein [Duncaniella sp.]